jgi:flagellar L-ring protein precursor FlgH
MTMRSLVLTMAVLAAGTAGAAGEPGFGSGAAGRYRVPVRAGEDSIWGSSNMLADRQVKEHDLITIVIRETNSASTSLETQYEKDFQLKLGIGKAFNVKADKGLTYEPLTAASKKPELDISHNRKHEGEGEIKHQEKFEARVTAEVIEVMPNGDLMLEARKRVSIGEERSELVLTGRVRPQDVRSDNTVESDRVADSHIRYAPKGAVGDANKRGWLHRLFDFVNVF